MTSRTRRLLPWLALATVYVVWGSTYLAIRVAVEHMPPFAAAGLRFVTAGLIMAGIAAVTDRRAAQPSRRQLADYALVGVLLLAFGNGVVMWAEQFVPSGIAALIVATVPLWMTFLDGLRPGGQPWTARVWLGTALGFLGVGLVARPGASGEAIHWMGIGALALAPISWSIGSLYAQSRPRKLPLFTAAAVEMLAGGVVLCVESWLTGEDLTRFAGASTASWVALLHLTLFGSLVAFTAFAYCLNTLPASTVGTYAYVNPVLAVTLGSVFLGETLSPGLVTGGALIVGAVLLTTLRPRRRPAGTPDERVQARAAQVEAGGARSTGPVGVGQQTDS